MTVLSSLGIGIGAYFGGVLLPRFGSRKLIIATNMIGLIFNVLKLIENTIFLMVARLGLGICMGVALICLSRVINDTVPAKSAPQYGAFINAGFAIGIFTSNFMGLILPMDDGNDGDL